MATRFGSGFLLHMTSQMTNQADPHGEASTTKWTPVGWLKELLTGDTSRALFPFFDCGQRSLFFDPLWR